MALQWMEGFDWIAGSPLSDATFPSIWSYSSDYSTNPKSAPGEYDGLSFYFNNGPGNKTLLWRSITAQPTQILGWALNFTATETNAGAHQAFGFSDGSGKCIAYVDFTASGVDLYLGGAPASMQTGEVAAQVATSHVGNLPAAAGWNYYELAYTPGATGTLVLRQNGVEIGSVSGDTTPLTGLGSVFIYQLMEVTRCYVDNMYLADSTGTTNNSFLAPVHGDVRVETYFPTGAGSSTQFTPFPAATNNYADVDDQAQDGDATYVYSSTAGAQDLYGITPAVPATDSVLAFGVNYVARKDDTGARAVSSALKSGATTVAGATYNATASYVRLGDLWETDPNTGVAWTVAAINAGLEIGLNVVS